MRKAVYESHRVARVSTMALSHSAWQCRSLLGLCLQTPPTTLLTAPT